MIEPTAAATAGIFTRFFSGEYVKMKVMELK